MGRGIRKAYAEWFKCDNTVQLDVLRYEGWVCGYKDGKAVSG